MESTNLRQEVDELKEQIKHTAETALSESNEKDQKSYNERMDEYKENSRSSRASNLYGENDNAVGTKRTTHSEYNPCTIEPQDHRPRSRKLHDSHFSLGVDSDHEANRGVTGSEKFRDRYANKSLETTNVGDAKEQADENEQNEHLEEHNSTDEHEETDHAVKSVHEDIGVRDNIKNDKDENSSMRESPVNSRDEDRPQSQLDEEAIEQQGDIDREVDAKASAGRSDHRHFETERSLPWMRMIPGDKNLSEQMFLYLTHNELKERIQNLEKRENQACSKHQWDEALRLRDMRNRLDVAREKNLYRRDDLQLDPEVKRLGMASIEARQKLLKNREDVCTNSSIYSEEAKAMWDQWVREDRQSVLEDARLQREVLMAQLEENWRSLAIEDKQRISDSFKNKKISDLEFQNSDDNLSVFLPSTR